MGNFQNTWKVQGAFLKPFETLWDIYVRFYSIRENENN